MILPIFLYGHPVLRNISKEVTPNYPELKTFVKNMYDTMYKSEGVGLAAPQVGHNVKIVVIDADAIKETCPECAGRKLTLINPIIKILDGEKISRNEGCLSFPSISETVSRIEHIWLKWVDENFDEHQEEISGFLARIVQHECDHLEGKFFIDHISPIRKQLIRSKLNNIISGETQCDYPVRYAPKKKKK